MKKVKFIYNPNSGERKVAHELDKIVEIYQENNYTVVPFRLCKSQPISNAFEDINENYDHILISGGDGTIDLIVNAMKQLNINIPIGILPSGTANDFAKAVNLSFDIRNCIYKIIKSKPKMIDIGKINDKYFINVASAGMFTDVSQKINPEIKNSIGKVSYYLKGIEEALYMRKFYIEVSSKEVSYKGDMYLMLIFNGKTAGNINLAYKAKVDDGLLDVIIVKNVLLPNMLPLLISILKGEHLENYNEDEILYFKTNKLKIDCKDNLITDIDGEKGPDFPLEIECIEEGIELLGYV
ncbi:YegS/Rv2252/BmrU family lipid kinase [Terrisporobacter sp.]|uniref:YegS/Rv2252/BmrU family lipid kinase n=1 Tax=Terrisporobacter sp. TaxID=1965305 RepID=UPI0026073740|nr:YegS/Rv2252/BmrU family lipid kinase [Terrisporobacter sp.]